jgi:methionyl-tRNA formyltransferase
VVRSDLPRAVAGELTPVAQPDVGVSHAPLIGREHTTIDWTRPALQLINLTRGMAPRPGAHTTLGGKSLRVLALGPAQVELDAAPGTLRVLGGTRLLVRTGDGAVELVRAQLEGRKALDARDLLNGRTLKDGDRLGN